MIQNVMSVIAAFFGSLGFSIIYNIRGQRLWIPSIGGAVFWAVYLAFLHFVDNEYLGFFVIAILITIPGVSPIADYAIEQIGKIGLLPLCTPILAYAGISIGKDVDTFKKQGFAIVVVAIFTFAGTFLGSTIIAQIILKMTGVI